MHVHEALAQVDAIHAHLARAEVYRGFQASGVAAAGVAGLVAATAQPTLTPDGFVRYWVAVAVVGATLGGGAALYAYLFREDEFARRRTRRVLAQFLPCVLAGACLTAGLSAGGDAVVRFLPGVWAVVFGLGVTATRPYLPNGISGVGLFYVSAGAAALFFAGGSAGPSGWAVGGIFGPGHLMTAWVLRRREEAADDV